MGITDAYRLIIPPKKVDDSKSVESDTEDAKTSQTSIKDESPQTKAEPDNHPEPESKKPKPKKVIDEGTPPLQIPLTTDERKKFIRHKLNNNIIKAVLDLLDSGKLQWLEKENKLEIINQSGS